MKLKLIVFLAISFIIISCYSSEKEIIPEIKKEKQLFPVLKDTLGFTAKRLDIKFMKPASYKPIFLGKFTDTLLINHLVNDRIMFNDTTESVSKHFNYSHISFRSNPTYATSENIKIIVDTTTIIKKIDLHDTSTTGFTFEAHPIYISNISKKDTIFLGFNYDVHAKLEAKNQEGIWKSIERKTFVGCPVGLKEFVLKPQDTILTSTPIFKGNFKTKLRLTLGEAYSNEFDSYINKQQFVLSTF